jgi:hypothetical protein
MRTDILFFTPKRLPRAFLSPKDLQTKGSHSISQIQTNRAPWGAAQVASLQSNSKSIHMAFRYEEAIPSRKGVKLNRTKEK